jgi:predicted nuclease with TOPRIM domain
MGGIRTWKLPKTDTRCIQTEVVQCCTDLGDTIIRLEVELDATIDRLTGLGRLTEKIDDSLARTQNVIVVLADRLNDLEARIKRLETPLPMSYYEQRPRVLHPATLGRPHVIRLADHSNPTRGQSHE